MLIGALVTLLAAGLAFFYTPFDDAPLDLALVVITAIGWAGLWIRLALAAQVGRRWTRGAATALLAAGLLFTLLGAAPDAWRPVLTTGLGLPGAVTMIEAVVLGPLSFPLAGGTFTVGLIAVSAAAAIHVASVSPVVDAVVLGFGLVALVLLWLPASEPHIAHTRSTGERSRDSHDTGPAPTITPVRRSDRDGADFRLPVRWAD